MFINVRILVVDQNSIFPVESMDMSKFFSIYVLFFLECTWCGSDINFLLFRFGLVMETGVIHWNCYPTTSIIVGSKWLWLPSQV